MSTLRIAAVIPARLGFHAAVAQGAAHHRRPAHGGVGVARSHSERPDGPRGGGHRCGRSGRRLPRALDSRSDDLARVRQRVGSGEGSGAPDRRRHLRQHPGRRADADAGFFPASAPLFERPEVEVATLAVRCPPEEFANPNAVKVVTALDGRALYFSRATIPFDRDARALPAIASISASTPTARPRWSGLPRSSPRRSKSWSAWSSCGCSKTASPSMWPTRRATRSAWIRKRIWCGRRSGAAANSSEPRAVGWLEVCDCRARCRKRDTGPESTGFSWGTENRNCAQESECAAARIGDDGFHEQHSATRASQRDDHLVMMQN